MEMPLIHRTLSPHNGCKRRLTLTQSAVASGPVAPTLALARESLTFHPYDENLRLGQPTNRERV